MKVIVFDIDLTLCDNFGRKRRAFELALGRNFTEEEWSEAKYPLSFHVVLRKLTTEDNRQKISDALIHHFFYNETLFELDKPFQGAVETVTRLDKAGYRIYYLTGRPLKQTAEKFLTKYGFPPGKLFAEKIFMGESHKKIRFLQEILNDSGVQPEEAVSIGDLPGDAEAAKKIGIFTICTLESKGATRMDFTATCDTFIERITELPKAIEELNRRINPK